MQDAARHRQPPSLFFGIRPRRKTLVFTKLDVMLADALRMYEDALCKGCGTPAVWAWDVRTSLYVELDPDAPQCQVCELLEIRQQDPDAKLEPGEKVRVLFDPRLYERRGV